MIANRQGGFRLGATGSLLALILVLGGLVGCAATPRNSGPVATWPVSPERLPDPTAASTDARVTCGDRAFPAAGLDAPAGALTGSGPEFDALRAAITKFGSEFPGSSDWSWRLAGRDASGAIFLAETDALGPPGWVSVEVAADATGWQPLTMGQCDPHVVLSPEFGPATWALDPHYPAPTETATELHILVWERTCSSGSPTTGRMSAPVVEHASGSVTITIGVRPLQVEPGTLLACPLPPGTPTSLRLGEPLGARTLLDGGRVPPAPPSPANGW